MIKSFSDLATWKEAHKLVLMIYKVTKQFPPDEKFGLIIQLRRAAVSVSSNIAEGFSRNTNKEKVQFYYMALGSLTEMQNQLIISKDLSYMSESRFDELMKHVIVVNKLINGMIKSAKVMPR